MAEGACQGGCIQQIVGTRERKSQLGLSLDSAGIKALRKEHVWEEALVMIGCLGPGA